MRALFALLAGALMVAATGCYHDKYDVLGDTKERYNLPPDEPRYNQADTATYRPPPPVKQQETLTSRPRGNPGGPGGF
jgi:hypothetical protein